MNKKVTKVKESKQRKEVNMKTMADGEIPLSHLTHYSEFMIRQN